MEDESQQEASVESTLDTKHEAHEHAHKRLMVGIGAVIFVLVAGGYMWSRWGDAIEEACFGEDEACEIDPSVTSEPKFEITEFEFSEQPTEAEEAEVE